jgi:hypothetical protein
MPKDRAEVQDQYKIGGGSLNEYEFDRSKGEMEEQERQSPEGTPAEGLHGAAESNAPQNVAARIRQVEERAHEIVERRRAKQSGSTARTGSAQKGAGKAAQKSAQKSSGASKKASVKKAGKASAKTGGAAKKGGAKKGGAKKGSAKKVAAKKGAAKRSGGSRR